ncbi:MAG: protein-L-isoaspartate(D-aspartate) O-methyltransferase [Bacteroidia bacterium]|nr:protein-L-isoaspartate(D-aspartate) O-methyltransferase [Bacteroidia bacterium]
MIDTYKLQGLRAKLVKTLREKGIQDEGVLTAVGKVPRHSFVESAFAEQAYDDRPLPIGDGQTISQPYTVARQSELLELKPGMKVLEIGTGSGYQAAILCEMGCKVFSIERIRSLHVKSQRILTDLGYKPRLKWGDGSPGWATYDPYDRILVTAASPSVPDTLKKQLAINGILVIPVGDLKIQVMMKITRKSQEEFIQQRLNEFQFVPMIGKHGWKEEQL